MIIVNERDFVEDMLSACEKPLHLSVRALIRYIAKYYYDDCCELEAKDYARFVLDAVKIFDIPQAEYQEYKYARYARDYCANLLSGLFPHELREVDEISFTADEIKRVNMAVYRNERKVLFTLYALAKIFSPTTGWLNLQEIDIFKMANVNVTNNDRLQILRSLYKNDLIGINRTMDKTGYHVELLPDSPIVYTTNNMSNFGNQYLSFSNPNVKICRECGRVYRPKDESQICPRCESKSS